MTRVHGIHSSRPAAACGFGALPVLMLMLLGSFLILLFANRTLLQELRAAAQVQRASEALEAAEAGRAWAQAWINVSQAIDTSCTPVPATPGAGPPGRSWRERLWPDASGAAIVEAGCVQQAAGAWACSCPTAAGLVLTAPIGDELNHPAFMVRLEAGPLAGSLRIRSTGCSAASSCNAPQLQDGRAQVNAVLTPWPLDTTALGAALQALGPVTLGPGVSLVNTQAASGGITLSAAGLPTLDAATQLVSLPGRSPLDSVRAPDPRWLDAGQAPLTAAAAMHQLFGLPGPDLQQLPGITHVVCPSGACTAADLDASLQTGARWLWLDGPLTLATATSVGTLDRPVLVIAPAITVRAAVQWHGWLHTDQLDWDSGASASSLRGTAFVAGPALLAGPVRISHDAALLDRLRRSGLPLLAVPGAWRDHTEGS